MAGEIFLYTSDVLMSSLGFPNGKITNTEIYFKN